MKPLTRDELPAVAYGLAAIVVIVVVLAVLLGGAG